MVKLVTLGLLLAAAAATPAAAAPVANTPEPSVAQLNCDTLSMPIRLDPATLHDLGPAHSLDAAAAVLSKHGVKYARSKGVMTLDGVSPQMMRDINMLPEGEPIILPTGEGSAICVLRPSADSI